MTDQVKTPDQNSRRKAWFRLRGCMKDIFAELGGGEAFLRQEREEFNRGMERREALIGRAMQESRNSRDCARSAVEFPVSLSLPATPNPEC